MQQCAHQINPAFGDAVKARLNGWYEQVQASPELKDAYCTMGNWVKRSEICGHCVHTLTVTEPPGHESDPLCLGDFTYLPYDEKQHMTDGSPLNGAERELVLHKNDGCSEDDWSGDHDPQTKIAVVDYDLQAQCGRSLLQALNAFRRGGAMVLTFMRYSSSFEYENRPPDMEIEETLNMDPKTFGITDSLHYLAWKQPELDVFKMLKENKTVKGYVTYNCNEVDRLLPDSSDQSQYYGDSCPWWYMQTYDICGDMPRPTQRLCSACPLEARDPSAGDNEEALACVYTADLLPQRKELTFHGAFFDAFPLHTPVTYLKELPQNDFCDSAASFPTEAVSGKIVAVETAKIRSCLRTTWLKFAAEAGVRAVLILSENRLQGWANNINIPIGNLGHRRDSARLMDFFKDTPAVTIGNGTGKVVYHVRNVTFAVGSNQTAGRVPLENVAPESSARPEEGESSYFDQPGIVVSVVLMPLLCLAVGVKLKTAERQTVGTLRGDGLGEVPGVSLSLSSTTLSLGLAVIVSALIVGLTQDAHLQDIDSLERTSDASLAAVNARNTQNVRTLTTLFVEQLLEQAVTSFSSWKREALGRTDMLQAYLRASDPPRFGEFKTRVGRIKEVLDYLPIPEVGVMGWQLQVYMSNGMYWDASGFRNGGLDDDEWNGYNTEFFDGGLRGQTINRSHWNPMKHLYLSPIPDEYSNVFEFVQKNVNMYKVREGQIYYTPVQREVMLHSSVGRASLGPMLSVIAPVKKTLGRFTRGDKLVGTMVMSMPASHLAQMVRSELSDGLKKNPIAQNMSLYIIDEHGFVISSFKDEYQKLETFPNGGEYNRHTYSMPHVATSRHIELVAFANMMQASYGKLVPVGLTNGSFTVEFDQHKHYVDAPCAAIQLHFENQTLADTSGEAWGVRTRCRQWVRECAVGYRAGRQDGGTAVTLDGNTSLWLAPFLTSAVPRVNASSDRIYSVRMTYQGFEGVVMADKGLTKKWGGVLPTVIRMHSPYDGKLPIVRALYNHGLPFTVSLFVRPLGNTTASEAQIFTDSPSGDAGVRWYADGRLLLGVLQYGCRTEAVHLPEGEWTHLAASVDFEGLLCTVFVNGELASQGQLSHSFVLPELRDGYVVGHGFVGAIDDLEVWNRSVTPADVRAYLKRGVPVHVESKNWTASLLTRHEVPGMPGTLHVALVPTTDVIRDVQSHNTYIQSVTMAKREEADQFRLHKHVEVVLVTIVILLVATLVFLVFNDVLTKPFALFASNIYRVAMMDLDYTMDNDPPCSLVREINVMHQAMGVMVKNMREFKPFMPISVVSCYHTAGRPHSAASAAGSDRSDTDSVPTPPAQPQTHNILNATLSPAAHETIAFGRSAPVPHDSPLYPTPQAPPQPPPPPLAPPPEHLRHATGSQSVVAFEGRRRPRGAATAAVLLAASLSRRRMSFVVANLLHFHQLCDTMTDTAILSTHSEYVANVLQCSLRHAGLPETFAGDKMFLTFNGLKKCVQHGSCAAATALKVSTMWDRTHLIKVSLAATTGTVKAGHIGAATMRRCCAIGAVVPWTYALERLARGEGYSVLCNQRLVEHCRGTMLFKHELVVSYKKVSESRQLASKVIGRKTDIQEDEDWDTPSESYSNTTDKYKRWNELLEALAADDLGKACRLLETKREHISEAVEDERELAFLNTLSHFTPIELKY